MFWHLSIILYHIYFSPAARGGPVCRRVSRDVCGDCGSPPSGTGGWEFCLRVFQQLYTMYIPPRPRGGNRFAGGSLETFAANLVRLRAEREGGDFVLGSFNNFIPHIFLPGCAGGTGLPAGLYRRLRRFWFASKRNGRVWILFWRLSTILYHIYFSPAARGEPVCRQLFGHVCGDFGSPPSGTGGW